MWNIFIHKQTSTHPDVTKEVNILQNKSAIRKKIAKVSRNSRLRDSAGVISPQTFPEVMFAYSVLF